MKRTIESTNWFPGCLPEERYIESPRPDSPQSNTPPARIERPTAPTPPPASPVIAPVTVMEEAAAHRTDLWSDPVPHPLDREDSPRLDSPARSKPRKAPRPRHHANRRDRGQTRVRQVLMAAALLCLVVGWTLTLRPTRLGGPASVLTVRGVSMEPKYHPGDMVVTHRHGTYQIGDIIAYHVPAGEIGAGTVVIHRIIGGDGQSGFTTQGDNNPEPDDWHPRQADVLGSAWLRIPIVGRIGSSLRSIPITALLAAVIAVILVLVGTDEQRETRRRDDDSGAEGGEATHEWEDDPLEDLITLPPLLPAGSSNGLSDAKHTFEIAPASDVESSAFADEPQAAADR